MGERSERAWVAVIAKKLRDDLGDLPTVPEEMLRLLQRLKEGKNEIPSQPLTTQDEQHLDPPKDRQKGH